MQHSGDCFQSGEGDGFEEILYMRGSKDEEITLNFFCLGVPLIGALACWALCLGPLFGNLHTAVNFSVEHETISLDFDSKV